MAVNGLGLGHIVRCKTVADELLASGADVLFSTYQDGLEFARRKRLKAVESLAVFYRVRSDGSIDLRSTTARSGFSLGVNRFLHQLIQEIQYIRKYNPDVVLVDTRLSSLIAARLAGKRVILILNQYRIRILHNNDYPARGFVDWLFLLIARLGWVFLGTLLSEMWGLAKEIMVPDFPPPLTVSTYNLVFPRRHMRKVSFVGPILDSRFYNDTPKALLKRRYRFDPDKTLIYAGVSGPKHEREPLVKKLMPLLASVSERHNIVMSCGNPSGTHSPKYLGRMCVYEWAENQDDLLHACDMVICRAGQSMILKTMVLGIPLLLIPTPFQTEQLGNADRARSIGTAMILDQGTLTNQSLVDAIRMMTDNRNRFEKASQIANQVREIVAAKEYLRILLQAKAGAQRDSG